MERIYRTGVYLALPFALVSQCAKGFRNRGYWRRWPERLGRVTVDGPIDFWVHAVSVGEVRAAVPMIRRLLAEREGIRVLVTTMTPTGSDTVKLLLDNEVQHCYLPYDTGRAMTRFFDRVAPKLAVVMETEIWPNLIRMCKQRDIPVAYINVRLSQRSFERYRRLSGFMARTIERIDLIAAQGSADAERLRQLGAEPKRVHVTGSMKFDVKMPASVSEAAQMVRRAWSDERPVWIAGSTREGEESLVLEAHKTLRERVPGLLLLLVPRHPERFDSVYRLCRRAGLEVARHSDNRPRIESGVDVYLGDTMGELALLYAAADVAFVGGSLVPKGGQNILEPCALGVPVVFGPHMFNFQEISEWTVGARAGFQVRNPAQLVSILEKLLKDGDFRFRTGENGQNLIAEHRGAIDRVYALLQPYI